jgi:hypothetical protein
LRTCNKSVLASFGASRSVARTLRASTVPNARRAAKPESKYKRQGAHEPAVFFCDLLDAHGVKPQKVLRKAGLAGADWDEPTSVKALSSAAQKYFPRSVPSDSDPDVDADDDDDAAAAAFDSDDSDWFSFAFVGSAQGLSFSLFMVPPDSYVEGTSLTTSLRYQDSRLEIS